MDTISQTRSTSEAPSRGLKVADRCDHGGCQAQAFVRATLLAGELLFCGHHFAKHEPSLVAQSASVDDFRHLINDKASESSA